MVFQINGDQDLCWYYLSSTGCRKSNCTWRHANPTARFYRNYIHKPGKGHYGEDPRKTAGAKFYPRNEHQDGGIEDQYGLVHYPRMDKKDGWKKSFRIPRRRGYRQDSAHARSFWSPMSDSSFGKSSPTTSTATSMIISAGGSDSEDDMVKSVLGISKSDLAEVDKRNPAVFGEFKTPRKQMQMKWLPDEGISSPFSPFAKVFVPRRKSVKSKEAIISGFSESLLKNRTIDNIQQLANLKSCDTENDQVNE